MSDPNSYAPETLKHRHPDVQLRAGEYTAAISTLGSTLRAISYSDAPLLVGFDADEYAPMSSGTILSPWPNRTADGAFIHQGRLYRLEITEPERANAIHGFVAQALWSIEEQADDRVVLTLRDGSHVGWPWFFNYRAVWTLDKTHGLTCELTVDNASDCDAPIALGFHPYITAHGEPLDECSLHAPVDTFVPLEPQRNLPAGPLTSTEHLGVAGDLRDGLALNNVFFDHCFGPVAASDDGYEVALVHDATGKKVVLRSSSPCRWLQIFTADPARRAGYPGVGRALAVEPMTAPPNALRTGTDLVVLAPAESITVSYSIAAQ